METQSNPVPQPADQEPMFQQLESYNWADDQEFQSGLQSILINPIPEELRPQVEDKARCFYFTRKFGTPVDFEAYSAWKTSQSSATNGESQSASSTQPPAVAAAASSTEKPSSTDNPISLEAADEQPPGEPPAGPRFSYQEIVEMIQNGTPIPGIKEIPNTILEGQGTEPSKPARRKPWEKDTVKQQPISTASEGKVEES